MRALNQGLGRDTTRASKRFMPVTDLLKRSSKARYIDPSFNSKRHSDIKSMFRSGKRISNPHIPLPGRQLNTVRNRICSSNSNLRFVSFGAAIYLCQVPDRLVGYKLRPDERARQYGFGFSGYLRGYK